MKVSIITVTFNSASTIADTLRSVASQDYSNIEHIVVDGASKDNTLEEIKQYDHVAQMVSEPDKAYMRGTFSPPSWPVRLRKTWIRLKM